MANYVLSLVKEKGAFQEIAWNKIPAFIHLDNHVLKDVDFFTTSFKDEDNLKEELVKHGLLSLDDYNRKLCVRYKSRGLMKKLEYGIAYHEDKMLLDEISIAYYLESNIDNIELLEKLCNHYRSSYIQGSNINAIRNHINNVKNNVELWPDDIKHIHSTLKDFVIRETFSYDASNYSYKTDRSGTPLVKYKGVHDLGMFFAYDKRKNILKEKEEPNAIIEPVVYKIIPIEKQKVKMKVNKNEDVPGQMSLFD